VAAPILLYTTRYCGYCSAAKQLLSRRGYAFKEVDVADPVVRDEVSARAGNYRTVPMIFIGDEFIGGFDELSALDRSGELNEKIVATAARAG
jgi:glutaredoxin 3